MNRHGIIVPREDGVRARCMGLPTCKECILDAREVSRAVLIDYVTGRVANALSAGGSVHIQVKMIMDCMDAIADPENECGPVQLTVPLVGCDPEIQLLGAVMHLYARFGGDVGSVGLTRVANYMAEKYACPSTD